MFKKILISLRTENIFAGLNTTLLNDLNLLNGKDFNIEITPNVNITRNKNNYQVIFNKTGDYKIRFFDLRKGKQILFEKKITVNIIPDPIVKVKGDNLNSFLISKKNLLNAERLEAKIEINNLNTFPGRVNSFRVIRVNNGKEEESNYNIGELFHSNTLKIIGALKKNDFLIFENVNMTLVDGSTRIASPIIYKIID
jgi:hypothetical protein